MIVHLLRSHEYALSDYAALCQFLIKSGGPVSFVPSKNSAHWMDHEIEELNLEDKDIQTKMDYPVANYLIEQEMSKPHIEYRTIVEWDDVFKKCAKYRRKNNTPEHELIVLLTRHANEYNWFSAGDPSGARNYFIQTAMWDLYVDGSPQYAIAYEVAALIIQSQMFDRYDQLAAYAHTEAQGCLNDLCTHKPDIRFKLRTADLCD